MGGISPNLEGPLLKPEDKDGSTGTGLAPAAATVPPWGTRVTWACKLSSLVVKSLTTGSSPRRKIWAI